MLIDFTVENYRSIKTPVTLSAIAQKPHARQGHRNGVVPDNEIAPPYVVEGRNFELLPVLALYGANASGKTNVLTALDNLLTLLRFGMDENWFRRFAPFRLDASTEHAPRLYTLRVLINNTIYIYTIAFNQERILMEQMEYLPPKARRTHALYKAEWNESKQQYAWKNGADFSGPHKVLQPIWRGRQQPYLTLSASFFSPILEPLTDWLRGYWRGVSLGDDIRNDEQIAASISSSTHHHEKVVQIVQQFDFGLSGIEIEMSKTEEEAGDRYKPSLFEIFALHETSSGTVRWSFEEESHGTRNLFPMVHKMLAAFETGGLMLVDELGANIHPNLTRYIIRLFQSPKSNPKRSQLLFTTHDSNLLRRDLLRRDQVWFTEKRVDGSTDLYSLGDFKPRNDLALDRAYLDGRFGAVPILPSDELLMPFPEEKK